mmetsp:Transcript_23613/g.57316  ORF Transcript_23613/g.57316 Transcript_23613/m.57316 type:complete len:271 (-) Transcript_23613:52-864(-)
MYWEALLGGDPRACGVQGELADGDPHTVRAKVTQSENPLPVREANSLDTLLRVSLQNLADAAPVTERYVEPPWGVPVDLVPFYAGLPHRRGVDIGHALERMVHKRRKKEVLVPVLYRGEVVVALNVRHLASQLLHHVVELHMQRHDPRGQQPPESEPFAVLQGGADAVREEGGAETVVTGQLHPIPRAGALAEEAPQLAEDTGGGGFGAVGCWYVPVEEVAESSGDKSRARAEERWRGREGREVGTPSLARVTIAQSDAGHALCCAGGDR